MVANHRGDRLGGFMSLEHGSAGWFDKHDFDGIEGFFKLSEHFFHMMNHRGSSSRRKLSHRFRNLTTTEIQVAHMIKDGKSSKEIADIMGVSSSAIDVYRYRIRKKLGLNKQKVNLRTHLLSIP